MLLDKSRGVLQGDVQEVIWNGVYSMGMHTVQRCAWVYRGEEGQ